MSRGARNLSAGDFFEERFRGGGVELLEERDGFVGVAERPVGFAGGERRLVLQRAIRETLSVRREQLEGVGGVFVGTQGLQGFRERGGFVGERRANGTARGRNRRRRDLGFPLPSRGEGQG